MSDTKEPLSKSAKKDSKLEFDAKTDSEEAINLGYVVKNGLLMGLITYLTLGLIAIIINYTLGTNVLLVYFGDLVFLIAASFFLFSGFVIWFGPSPQWAIVKKSITKRNAKPISTSDALSVGLARSLTAIFLIISISI